MKVLTYRITLQEPALLTSLGGDANNARSLGYIPGSAIRGVLLSRFQRHTPISASEESHRRLFFDATTRYLNAYPVIGDDHHRSLPIPRSWYRNKLELSRCCDFAVDLPDDYREHTWSTPPGSFCDFEDIETGSVKIIEPKRRISVHTQRARRAGRATDQEGAVFRYESIAAGQMFAGAILIDETPPAIDRQNDGPIECYLGGSRTATYGRAKIERTDDIQDGGDWREVPMPIEPHDNQLIITLLSDALIRDPETGQFCTRHQTLTDLISKQLDHKLECRDAYVNQTIAGGFNRKWGLPLPQTVAFGMGTVIVCKTESFDEEKIRALEQTGIGERRAEGFGRLAFNAHPCSGFSLEVGGNSERHDTGNPDIASPSGQAALTMVKRRTEKLLKSKLISITSSLEIRNPPSRSQLSRLRQIIREELLKPAPNPARLEVFMTSIKARKTARKQFQTARIGNQTLLNWLSGILEVHKKLDAWQTLFNFHDQDQPRLGGIKAEPDEPMRSYYLLSYIDTVLARTQKKSRQR